MSLLVNKSNLLRGNSLRGNLLRGNLLGVGAVNDFLKKLILCILIVFCGGACYLFGKKLDEPKLGELKLDLNTSAFSDGQRFNRVYTCEGRDISPPLSWSFSKGTRFISESNNSFVLIFDDPDAPNKTWVHWVIYNIPGNYKNLAEDFGKKGAAIIEDKKNGKKYIINQGVNSWGNFGWGGPCPPRDGKVHRYFLKLYLLDTHLKFKKNKKVTKDMVMKAAEGHIIGRGEIMAYFSRKPITTRVR